MPPISRDLSSPVPWRRSLRAARERRAAVARRRRRHLRGRSSVLLALVATALAAGGALAQDAAAPQAPGAATRADAVRAVQAKLGVAADGVIGPRTRAAVRRFQRRAGLQVDGIAGPQTLRALGISAGATAPRPTGSPAGAGAASATLERIARCESGGEPTAVSSGGRYRGKYQFDRATWRALGGTGDPATASEAEQDRLAAKLLAQSGTAPWPSCAG